MFYGKINVVLSTTNWSEYNDLFCEIQEMSLTDSKFNLSLNLSVKMDH